MATGLGAVPNLRAASSDTIRIGRMGCGNRGSGAAAQAMKADKNCKLVAMGDVFRDRLFSSRARFKKLIPEKVGVKDEFGFVGLDAYKQVIDSGVDVVLLTTTPQASQGRRRGRQTRLCREARGG